MTCTNCHKELAANSAFCYYCGAQQPVGAAYIPLAQKRLVRSADAKIGGVCGGLAAYLDDGPDGDSAGVVPGDVLQWNYSGDDRVPGGVAGAAAGAESFSGSDSAARASGALRAGLHATFVKY